MYNNGGSDCGERKIDQQASNLNSPLEGLGDVYEGWEQTPTCLGIRPQCGQSSNPKPVCADCQFLYKQHLVSAANADFLRHCRAIREYVDQGINDIFSPYVAAVLVGTNGRILDIDERSANYLRSSGILRIQHNRISGHETDFDHLLAQAIERVSVIGKPETLICSAARNSAARYSILLQPNRCGSAFVPNKTFQVTCLLFPVGRRRVASAHQLISLFGLSPAEARLARAICHGETLEEYAKTQNVKLPTVKTQLRAVFAKTQTNRQVALVTLISSIPPLR